MNFPSSIKLACPSVNCTVFIWVAFCLQNIKLSFHCDNSICTAYLLIQFSYVTVTSTRGISIFGTRSCTLGELPSLQVGIEFSRLTVVTMPPMWMKVLHRGKRGILQAVCYPIHISKSRITFQECECHQRCWLRFLGTARTLSHIQMTYTMQLAYNMQVESEMVTYLQGKVLKTKTLGLKVLGDLN